MHSPGSWKWNRLHCLCDGDGKHIVCARNLSEDSVLTGDARLIERAPELLEALRDACEVVDLGAAGHKGPRQSLCICAKCMGEALIREIEGE